MLLKQTWVPSPSGSKASLLTLGGGEGRCSLSCKAEQGAKAAHARKTGRISGWGGERQPGNGFLIGWWGNRASTSAFWLPPLQGLCAWGQHAADFFHLLGTSNSAKQPEDMSRNIICSPWRGAEVPYFVLLHSFPLFLCLLTFLITFALWNSGTASEAKVFPQARGRGHSRALLGTKSGWHLTCKDARINLHIKITDPGWQSINTNHHYNFQAFIYNFQLQVIYKYLYLIRKRGMSFLNHSTLY